MRNSIFGTVDAFNRLFQGLVDFKVDNFHYQASSFPPSDVYVEEDSKDVIFEFSVAGYTDDLISIDFAGDYLTLDFKALENSQGKKGWIHRGIKRSQANAKYFIPSDKYDFEKASANLKNGVLKIIVPAREVLKPKKISIST